MFRRGFLNNPKPARPTLNVEPTAKKAEAKVIQKEISDAHPDNSTSSAPLPKGGLLTVDEVEVTMGELLKLHLRNHSVEKISEMVETGAINVGNQPKDLSKGYNDGLAIEKTTGEHDKNGINSESDVPWDLCRYEETDCTCKTWRERVLEAWASMDYPMPSMRVCKSSDGSILCVWAYPDMMPSIPTTIAWRRPPMSAPTSYEIVKISGKGQGMRARRAIGRGETIVCEMPVVIVPGLIAASVPEQGAETGLRSEEQLLMNSLEHFGPVDKARILALTGFNQPGHGIMHMNTVRCEFSQGILKTYGGLCLEIARINHSCTPNAICKFKPRELVVEVRALQPIAAGAEITIAYRDLTLHRACRRSELQTLYSFLCRCATCDVSDEDVAMSDARRENIVALCYRAPTAFHEWLASKDAPATPLLMSLLELIKQIDKERLDERRGVPIRWLAHVYAANGDRRLFEKWAQEAVEYVPLLTTDEGFCDAGMWVRWLDDPVAHPLWNVRNRKA